MKVLTPRVRINASERASFWYFNVCVSTDENLGGEEKATEKNENQEKPEDMDVSNDTAEDKGVNNDKNNEEEEGICIARLHVFVVTLLHSIVLSTQVVNQR